jgi:TetR/AcrR family transcriptional regulator, transcriptional repressor for nem operon
MTDSAAATATDTDRRPGKRERLVAAAARLLHEHGIERTTLADIAKAADVPPGNVYYYFKTKDEVIGAVVDAHAQQIASSLRSIDARYRTPRSRLKALVREFAARGEEVADYGCPFGSLCSELGKRARDQGVVASRLMSLPIKWAEQQFVALGRDDAHDLAMDLLAAYEGSALLANALRDPAVLSGAARRLDRWIDAI